MKKHNGDHLLFIEAKRVGNYFALPRAKNPRELCCMKRIKLLVSDDAIKEAMHQVRNYCLESGCEYAAITNGIEWIFFKTFEKGRRWDSLNAFVVRDVNYFVASHTDATNKFSYRSIIEHASLVDLLSSTPPRDREVFFAKQRIPSYSHAINANRLAEFLRPVVGKLFGNIKPDQRELMERCYVSERDYAHATQGMQTHIRDSLTPYFKDFGVTHLTDGLENTELGKRISKSLIRRASGEVLVLFGGKGAGKSTFIRRLLHHAPPDWLRDHAQIAVIDLLNVPNGKEAVRAALWKGVVSQLDTQGILDMTRDTLVKTLFEDRFEVAKKQNLAGFSEASDVYNDRLNSLVAEWKSDLEYCARQLCHYWASKGRGAVVVVDNTDQYDGTIQDFCFTLAQEICDALSCVTLISMREERFYNSKIHGLLDAYQNSGFHISSPRPATVFLKRIEYTIELLRDPKRRYEICSEDDPNTIEEACQYLEIVAGGFKKPHSPLNRFLSAASHGDIRLSLDLFRAFLLSGYTNVDEMLAAGRWDFLIHQVIKPVMTPTRYFYDEVLSDIPNIFQLRDGRNASHFTALRILRRLTKGLEGGEPKFFDVAELRFEFSEKFQMLGDLERNLDMLLKHGFVEANNRVDRYEDGLDKIKITNYGQYIASELFSSFTYLDIICIDCGVFDESTHNYLVEASKDEYRLFNEGKRTDRVKIRLERVEEFLKYLKSEELRENEMYSLGALEADFFSIKAIESFEKEKVSILASAEKQRRKRLESGHQSSRRS
ncbi:MAG: hypothetical protein ACU0GE_16650 [Pseudooceanicola nanhaiensis]|uniref:hypothetical protein n=1 Tax=Pseudooceanicola nanhaiensis TaxID=375761 RepID=UPI004059356B